jgi:hypothetical protein
VKWFEKATFTTPLVSAIRLLEEHSNGIPLLLDFNLFEEIRPTLLYDMYKWWKDLSLTKTVHIIARLSSNFRSPNSLLPIEMMNDFSLYVFGLESFHNVDIIYRALTHIYPFLLLSSEVLNFLTQNYMVNYYSMETMVHEFQYIMLNQYLENLSNKLTCLCLDGIKLNHELTRLSEEYKTKIRILHRSWKELNTCDRISSLYYIHKWCYVFGLRIIVLNELTKKSLYCIFSFQQLYGHSRDYNVFLRIIKILKNYQIAEIIFLGSKVEGFFRGCDDTGSIILMKTLEKNMNEIMSISSIKKFRDFKAFHNKKNQNNHLFQDSVKASLETSQNISTSTFNKADKAKIVLQTVKPLMVCGGWKLNPLSNERPSHPFPLNKIELLKLQKETTPRIRLIEEVERSKNQIKKRCYNDVEGLLDVSVIFRTLTTKIPHNMQNRNIGFILKNISRNTFVLANNQEKDYYATRWTKAVALMENSGIISFQQKPREQLFLHILPKYDVEKLSN